MSHALICLALIAALPFMSFAQSDKPPAFDVADVHASIPTMIPQMTGGVLRGSRYEIRNATMVDLIKTAYGVENDSIVGGPSWLESNRFDILAKAPAGA